MAFPDIVYNSNGADVGRAFQNAMNSIWAMEEELPSLPQDEHTLLQKQYTWPVENMNKDLEALCMRLGMQVRDGVQLDPGSDPRELSYEHHKIYVFYEMIILKLPVEYSPSDHTIEDTYAHQVVDALLSKEFPAPSKYHLDWANLEVEGSKIRRVWANKPDGTISKNGAQLAFMEIKSPKDDRNARAEVEDLWNLANFCKDAIDAHLLLRRGIFKAAGILIFGHKISVYTMEYHNAIYHWSRAGVAHVPVDQTDVMRAPRCLELIHAVKMFLDSIEVSNIPQGPAGQYLHAGQKSKITPSLRPMF
ncbi:hypothetical protein BGZ74_000877 [Mortierella antarctica]|nr:hypothetical protein BGZ74_000877 [Mortierella antarctica]